jgi:hypothetical protein
MLNASWIWFINTHSNCLLDGFLIFHLKVETRLYMDTSEFMADVLNVVSINIISDYYYLSILLIKYIRICHWGV